MSSTPQPGTGATRQPAAPSEPRAGTGRRRLWISVILVIGACLAGEAMARVFAPSAKLLRVKQLEQALAGDDRRFFKDIIVNDAETFWRFSPNVNLERGKGPLFGLISNQQGLRARGDIAIPKRNGLIRILFLGDSCTFGYLLDDQSSFVALTEKELHRIDRRRAFECINAGVPGYTAFQCWRRLETEGFDYQPDLVVVQFGWNGSSVWDGRSDPEHYRANRATTPPGILRSSRLAQLVWETIFQAGAGQDGRARLAPSEMGKVLERIESACKQRGVGLLVLLTGSRTNLLTKTLTPLQAAQMQFASTRSFGPNLGPPLVDGVTPLTRLVQDGRKVDTLLFDNAHPTLAYNEMLASLLAAKIKPWVATQH